MQSSPKPKKEYANVLPAPVWQRVLYFRDRRLPHQVQSALERELAVLFKPGMHGGRLRMNAVANVNGIHFDFELLFLATGRFEKHFSLTAVASSPAAAPEDLAKRRQSSDSWFQVWTRDLIESDPPPLDSHLTAPYQTQCQGALEAQSQLDSIGKVQRAIIDGIKKGGRYMTSHKEGGTDIYWRLGKFIRSDYGDSPSETRYTDEMEFLEMLRRFCQFAVTINAASKPLPAIDEWKLVLRQMAPSSGQVEIPRMLPIHSTLLSKGLLISVIALMAAGLAAWQFLTIKSTGTPLGIAARSSTHVFQLITTTERHLPKRNRIRGGDRFRIDLLVIPIANPTQPSTFTLLRQQGANTLTPMTHILGADGDVVWVQALDLFAVNLKTGKILRKKDLIRMNPELGVFLNTSVPAFDGRFVAVSPEWRTAYAFPAGTLKANACPPPSRSVGMMETTSHRIEDSLCSGGWISTNEWIAVATAGDAQKDFKPGYSVPRDFTASDKDRNRVLFHGTANASEARPPILSSRQISATEYRDASFLRAGPGAKILLASTPPGLFLLYREGSELFAPHTLMRMTPDGNAVWKSPTDIGRVSQILPGTETVALVGDRPPVPDKVPEPILVLVNVAQGTTNTVTLWR